MKESISEKLKDFRVIVYSAGPDVRTRVDILRLAGVLEVSCVDQVSHEDMLRLYSLSRVYVGISVSNAISTSLLESMALGAFPVQTNTACCTEWIEDSKTGFEVPVDDVEVIANRVEKAITEDDLVDNAAELNWETVVSRLDKEELKTEVLKMYEFALSGEEENG